MNLFQQVELPKIQLNSFDLSHEVKLTTQFGRLTPVGCFEVNPGETHQITTNLFFRTMPLIAPIMHQVDAYVHWFFVPNRLLWHEWEDFITGGEDGSLVPPKRRVTANSNSVTDREAFNNLFGTSSLGDYLGVPKPNLGLPTSELTGINVHSLPDGPELMPFQCYNLIYNNYYRDQNVDPEEYVGYDDDGNMNTTEFQQNFKLLYRCWEKDYFASALPFTQRGPAAGFNFAGIAKINSKPAPFNGGTSVLSYTGGSAANGYLTVENGKLVSTATPTTQGAGSQVYLNPNNLQTDLSSISPVTINQLRMAYSLQRWLEASAVGGSRYIEQILTHFGVKSSDARLQRPEYLGGNRVPLMVSEVLQNSSTTEDSPQGNMAGHGIGSGTDFGFKRYFEEHGFIMGILSVRPRSSYQQGLPRMFKRLSRFDYYFPEFAHLGEQEIQNSEIYYTPYQEFNEKPFGYQSRYAEYKYMPSRVHGEFKNTLNDWHLGRQFTLRPTLSPEFLHINPSSLNRVFNVTDQNSDNLLFEIYLDYQALRPMPYFGKPAW